MVFDELKKAIKCPVCLDSMSEMTATKCGHLFCREVPFTVLRHCASSYGHC